MTIFEKVMVKLPDAGIQSFNTWIFSVIKNECLTRLRKRKQSQSQQEKLKKLEESEEKVEEIQEIVHLYQHPQNKTREEKLAEALQQLSPIQERCIRLFFYEERSYADIAEATNLPIKQIKSHLQNGKRLLKRYLEGV